MDLGKNRIKRIQHTDGLVLTRKNTKGAPGGVYGRGGEPWKEPGDICTRGRQK